MWMCEFTVDFTDQAIWIGPAPYDDIRAAVAAFESNTGFAARDQAMRRVADLPFVLKSQQAV